MKNKMSQIRNHRTVKSFSWNVIIIAAFGFLFGLAGIVMTYITRHIDFPRIDGLSFFLKPQLYFIPSIFQIPISSILLISSILVLKGSDKGRKLLIYGLITAILFLIIIPVITISHIPNLETSSKTWGFGKISMVSCHFFFSLSIAIYFFIAMMKFSKDEIRQLFR
jgi:hypothetical protein